MKIFISCPFTGLCENDRYVVKEKYETAEKVYKDY